VKYVSRTGEIRNAYKILFGKPEGRRRLGRCRRRRDDNIRLYVTEMRWEVVDWIHLVQDRDQ
jgi:hypothetical protein